MFFPYSVLINCPIIHYLHQKFSFFKSFVSMLGLARMLSISRNLKLSSCLRSPNEMSAFFRNSFCTTTTTTMTVPENLDDPTTMPESPQLPTWVNVLRTDSLVKDPDDDFVLPSMSYWVENYDKTLDVKRLVNDTKTVETDVDKISKIVMNPFESPESVVQALSGCEVCVTESLVEQLMKRFRSNWINVFGVFCWGKLRMDGSKFSSRTYHLMVECLGKARQFDLMWDVVKEMDQIGRGYVSLPTMALVMRRLAKAGRYDEAIDAFRGVEKFGIKRDVMVLNTIMDALVKERSVEHAHDVYLEFSSDIPPNVSSFNILIHGWSKVKDIERAQDMMEEMKKCGFCPNVVSYTCLIEYYCHEKDFRKVDEIIEEMKEKGCLPNVVTFTILMHALGKAKEIDKALKVYEMMKEIGCDPDRAFCNSLIYILNKSGRLKDATEVFEDMPRQGISHDKTSYNIMIASACTKLNEEEAFKLLRKMDESHIKPDCDAYTPLLKMCCTLKRMKLLSFLLSHMSKSEVSTDINIYAVLVSGLCKIGKLEHACMFFEEAVLKGFVPLDPCFKFLLKSLEHRSMSKAKERIEELMLQAQQHCSNHSFRTPMKIQESI